MITPTQRANFETMVEFIARFLDSHEGFCGKIEMNYSCGVCVNANLMQHVKIQDKTVTSN